MFRRPLVQNGDKEKGRQADQPREVDGMGKDAPARRGQQPGAERAHRGHQRPGRRRAPAQRGRKDRHHDDQRVGRRQGQPDQSHLEDPATVRASRAAATPAGRLRPAWRQGRWRGARRSASPHHPD